MGGSPELLEVIYFMIGQKLTPILEEIEFTIIDFDSQVNLKPQYGPNAIRSASKILLSVLMDKMWELHEAEKMPQEYRIKMAEACGGELRKLLKTYTGIDSFEFYSETIVGEDFIISKSI